MSHTSPVRTGSRKGALRRALAVALTFVLSFVGVAAIAPAASAALPAGLTATLLLNGEETYDGTPVVEEGDEITLRVQYGQEVQPGTEAEFTLGSNVTFGSVPAGNDMIESFERIDDHTMKVTFKNPLPGNNQGFFDLTFTVNSVDESQPGTITWGVNGEDTNIQVIVRNDGDQFENVSEGFSKDRTEPGNLNSYVSVDDDGNVVVSDAILNQDISYRLLVNSPDDRTGFNISDVLPPYMRYVEDSLVASLTTWDENGLNRTVASYSGFSPAFDENTFTGAVTVEGPSQLEITYWARVTDVAALQSLLQERYNALGGGSGNYFVDIVNTATFGTDTTDTATIRIQGSVAGVGIGDAFGKSASWATQRVDPNEDGSLTPPVDIDYRLRANLTLWDERNANFTLNQNVVIRDVLPAQASWKTGESDFITVVNEHPEGSAITLTEAATCPAGARDFESDAFEYQYCVSGNVLLINVGKDNSVNALFTVKAQLDTVSGLPAGSTTVVDADAYRLRNTAQFYSSNADPYSVNRDSNVWVPPADNDGTLEDSSTFLKEGAASATRVDEGDRVTVSYTFTVGANKGIDVRTARIIDYVDTTIFDVSDPDAVAVTGTYDGQALNASHFDLDIDDDGNLVIELSDAGDAVVEARGTDKELKVTIALTSRPFEAQETLEITNRATLEAEDSEFDYVSETGTEATSYGDEAEVRKRVFDRNDQEWTDTLQAYVDADGTLLEDIYVYRVEFIGHGSFGNVAILNVDDHLPDTVEFLGFIGEEDAADPQESDFGEFGPVNIGADLRATYGQVAHVVTITQAPDTTFTPGDRTSAFFAVRVSDPENVLEPIVNTIGTTEAIIDPQDPPSIDIEKWNDEGAVPEYDESGALTNDGYDGDFDAAPGKTLRAGTPLQINFTISNDGGEPLTNIVVSDDLTGGSGEIDDLVCTFPDGRTGTEWDGVLQPGTQFDCVGTLPALASGDVHADLAQVTGVGIISGTEVDDEDEWNAWVPTPSIDIEKWNDEGATPEYDASGALLNDGYDGDFDAAPGKPLAADTPLPINFTVSNDGEEDLIDVVVSDQLTGGVGEIQDLVCTFPDGSTGTSWEGPFAVGTQFDCVGTLPALAAGDVHSDNAQVTGVGIISGTEVDDADDWHAYVPTPSVDIEKWNDEGAAPEYDASGALLNDGYDGDFDEGPGKTLTAGKSLQINFTVSNDGGEDLIDVVVSDELVDGKGEIQDLVCTFPDGSTGTTWAGPFAVGTQFDCVGTLPALAAGDTHVDTATVTGVGIHSGLGADDADDWHGEVPADPETIGDTGVDLNAGVIVTAVLLLLGGTTAVIIRRRMHA